MSDLLVTAFVTFLVVIDPIGQAPLFAALTPGLQSGERRRIAAEPRRDRGLHG
jgi:multiple antibiotic resistance protein